MPQIEVSFDIDANGILNVSAKDKATGKEQSIVIRASSGLSDDEIDRMVKDAEAHAEEDRKFHELVKVRNDADNLIHATEKSLSELGEKVEASERADIEAAVSDLKTALESEDDVEVIQTKVSRLSELHSKLAERLYQQESPDVNGAPAGEAGAAEAGDDVVDAEFEEVKEDSK